MGPDHPTVSHLRKCHVSPFHFAGNFPSILTWRLRQARTQLTERYAESDLEPSFFLSSFAFQKGMVDWWGQGWPGDIGNESQSNQVISQEESSVVNSENAIVARAQVSLEVLNLSFFTERYTNIL